MKQNSSLLSCVSSVVPTPYLESKRTHFLLETISFIYILLFFQVCRLSTAFSAGAVMIVPAERAAVVRSFLRITGDPSSALDVSLALVFWWHETSALRLWCCCRGRERGRIVSDETPPVYSS